MEVEPKVLISAPPLVPQNNLGSAGSATLLNNTRTCRAGYFEASPVHHLPEAGFPGDYLIKLLYPGLDMLKRHQCIIDLKRGILVIGSSGTETKFLSEAELPPCARLEFILKQRNNKIK